MLEGVAGLTAALDPLDGRESVSSFYGPTAPVKVVPPSAPASTWTVLAGPGGNYL